MEVRVDPLSCEANGICAGLVPTVFALDDDDTLRVVRPDPPAELVDQVRHAVRSCPKAALSMTE